MTGKTHMITGATCAILISNPENLNELIALTIIGSLGGSIADIDTANSKISFLPKLAVIFVLFLAAGLANELHWSEMELNKIIHSMPGKEFLHLIGLIMFPILLIIGSSKKHRNTTHSIEFALMASLAVYCIKPFWGFPFLIGMASHMLLDVTNYQNITVSILFKYRASLKLFRSDGYADRIITICSSFAYGFFALTKVY